MDTGPRKAVVTTKLVKAFSILAFLGGTVRIFVLVLHTPVLGYANNYDMIRTQACIQVWPADASIPAGVGTHGSPLDRYEIRSVPELLGGCLPGSELLFGFAGKWIAQLFRLPSFSIRLFGVIHALALSVVALLFLLAFLRRAGPAACLVHSLIYLLVIADPANTLYLNTLYKEFAALFFAYTSFLLLWYLTAIRESLPVNLCLAASLLLLGLSSRQHVLLPAGFLFALALSQRTRWRAARATLILSLASVVATLSFYGLLHGPYARPDTYARAINDANATDTILGFILPLSQDPAEAAEFLGLPPGCVEHSGKTWYTPGLQGNHPCEEALGVSRFRLARFALTHPGFVVTATSQGISELRPWTLQHLGSVGDQQNAYAGAHAFTLSRWLDRLPEWALKVLFLLPLIPGALGLVIAFRRGSSPSARATGTLVVSLVLSLYLVFYSSLFGDGLYEFPKHTHLFFSVYLSLVIVTGLGAAHFLTVARRNARG